MVDVCPQIKDDFLGRQMIHFDFSAASRPPVVRTYISPPLLVFLTNAMNLAIKQEFHTDCCIIIGVVPGWP